jgi:hypothetical protein
LQSLPYGAVAESAADVLGLWVHPEERTSGLCSVAAYTATGRTDRVTLQKIMAMRSRWLLVTLVGAFIAAGCDAVLGIEPHELGSDDGSPGEDAGSPDADADGPSDAPADAPADGTDAKRASCDTSKPFGAPVAVSELNTGANESSARLTHDELNIYFARSPFADAGVDGGAGAADLFTASRSALGAPFGSITAIDALDTTYDEWDPSPTGNNLTLYYMSDQPGLASGGQAGIAVSTRASAATQWGPPAALSLNSPSYRVIQPYVLANDLTLYLATNATGSWHLYRSARSSTGAPFVLDKSGIFDAVNTSFKEWSPTVSPDELTVYFGSTRTDGGAKGGWDVWKATRASTADPFGAPTPVSELNTAADESPTWVSDDGCRLYLTVNTNQGRDYDIFIATKP